MTAAALNVIPLLRLTVRMLFPLPGSSGHQWAQMPTSNPAAAMAGISGHDVETRLGRASVISRLNSRPAASASGATSTATAVNR